ncbi:peptidoglycan editing factor PgeF [Hoyosella sp. YIM 151337]|uniref:peptidoglycan editing factor PgeF n=1 Tax=Hoyosella sp. YIM 151337 TaxID=2992742 RepID=UPI0022355104|nr:peptidoglycan editing factor PgeF [Hoyosella sp. YIM 151337]MCW4355430.1 peptidoglycan editing factor PgeF [Hoyosella sp. YIM 151337]
MPVRWKITTRAGGVSQPPYSSFNLGAHVGDEPAAVTENRRRLAADIGVRDNRVIWMDQVHGTKVAVVDGPKDEPLGQTDAVVTAKPGLVLAVLTADCVPVLLADETACVIGAAHAGRIGARNGVVKAVIGQMASMGADPGRITVLLGPAACGRCYEVPNDMRADVERSLPGSSATTRRGTPSVDIPAGIERQLRQLGVHCVQRDPRCTIEETVLFSYRRSAPTGRFASLIWMTE